MKMRSWSLATLVGRTAALLEGDADLAVAAGRSGQEDVETGHRGAGSGCRVDDNESSSDRKAALRDIGARRQRRQNGGRNRESPSRSRSDTNKTRAADWILSGSIH